MDTTLKTILNKLEVLEFSVSELVSRQNRMATQLALIADKGLDIACDVIPPDKEVQEVSTISDPSAINTISRFNDATIWKDAYNDYFKDCKEWLDKECREIKDPVFDLTEDMIVELGDIIPAEAADLIIDRIVDKEKITIPSALVEDPCDGHLTYCDSDFVSILLGIPRKDTILGEEGIVIGFSSKPPCPLDMSTLLDFDGVADNYCFQLSEPASVHFRVSESSRDDVELRNARYLTVSRVWF